LTARKAVLFDLDGVLVQSEHLKAAAHVATVHHFGGSASESVYREVMGRSHEEVRSAFLNAAGIHVDPNVYSREFRKTYHDLLQNEIAVVPGVPALLRELKNRKYRLAVISSTARSSLELVLARTNLDNYFDIRVSSEDVVHKKPAPDAYLKGLQKLGIFPNCAVVIEDSEAGVVAAARAGVPVIAVRHSYNARHDLSRANVVLDSLRDVNAVVEVIGSLVAQ
jgi:HAD superfamily hydrolase (TIGR01509 family)